MKQLIDVECVSLEEYMRERIYMLDRLLDSGIDYRKRNKSMFINPKITELNEKLNRVNWNTLGMMKG